LEKEQQLIGIAEVDSKRDVRIEILGYQYYVNREELAQLLHGYKKRVDIHKKTK